MAGIEGRSFQCLSFHASGESAIPFYRVRDVYKRQSFALAERAVAHDVVDVPPTAARPPGHVVPTEFVEHSPLGEIPMVRIGAEYRADSLPILDWLEDQVAGAPLRPSDPTERQRVRDMTSWICLLYTSRCV